MKKNLERDIARLNRVSSLELRVETTKQDIKEIPRTISYHKESRNILPTADVHSTRHHAQKESEARLALRQMKNYLDLNEPRATLNAQYRHAMRSHVLHLKTAIDTSKFPVGCSKPLALLRDCFKAQEILLRQDLSKRKDILLQIRTSVGWPAPQILIRQFIVPSLSSHLYKSGGADLEVQCTVFWSSCFAGLDGEERLLFRSRTLRLRSL